MNIQGVVMKKIVLTYCFAAVALFAQDFNAPMKAYMNELAQEAKAQNAAFERFDAKRGESIFTSKHIGKKGQEMACTSCHTANLKQSGSNLNTNKTIAPLAPSANKARLTDVAEVQKWLRRNFNDVYNREGSALEKGDVLTYLINQ
jgi:mono/diheme cytochrome c family protein